MKKTLTVGAVVENLSQVIEFIESNLEEVGCGMKTQTQIEVSVEELFVNIAHYAYSGAVGGASDTVRNGTANASCATGEKGASYATSTAEAAKNSIGSATITFDFASETRTVVISLIDSGVPYNPFVKPDPDITLSVEERQIGGLGIFMVKKNMDEVLYSFAEGKNITTIKKII